MTTKRLGFRSWEAADEGLAAALWSDSEVMRHMGGPYDQKSTRARLALEISRQEIFGFQYWPMFLRGSGEHVGCAGLRPFHHVTGVLELGVHVVRRFWSARFGEEAARAVIRHAFNTIGVRTLVAGTGPDNINSQALLGRLDFAFTHLEPWGSGGVLHPYYRLDSN